MRYVGLGWSVDGGFGVIRQVPCSDVRPKQPLNLSSAHYIKTLANKNSAAGAYYC